MLISYFTENISIYTGTVALGQSVNGADGLPGLP